MITPGGGRIPGHHLSSKDGRLGLPLPSPWDAGTDSGDVIDGGGRNIMLGALDVDLELIGSGERRNGECAGDDACGLVRRGMIIFGS